MKNRWIFLTIILVVAALILFVMVSKFKDNTVEYGSSHFKIIDATTKEQIYNVKVIITDLEKEYIITVENDSIYLPKKPYECYATSKCKHKGKYPYGYTTIITADGYLPRIDHNLILGYEDKQIIIELVKTEDASGTSHYYEEHFHSNTPNIIYELFDYYNIKQ